MAGMRYLSWRQHRVETPEYLYLRIMAVALKCYYHVGRVNTVRRIRRCWQAGADSFDWHERDKVLLHTPEVGVSTQQPSIPGLFRPHQILEVPRMSQAGRRAGG